MRPVFPGLCQSKCLQLAGSRLIHKHTHIYKFNFTATWIVFHTRPFPSRLTKPANHLWWRKYLSKAVNILAIKIWSRWRIRTADRPPRSLTQLAWSLRNNLNVLLLLTIKTQQSTPKNSLSPPVRYDTDTTVSGLSNWRARVFNPSNATANVKEPCQKDRKVRSYFSIVFFTITFRWLACYRLLLSKQSCQWEIRSASST